MSTVVWVDLVHVSCESYWEFGVCLNPKMRSWGLEFLVHVMSTEGLALSPKKISGGATRCYEVELAFGVGFCEYFRIFIPNFFVRVINMKKLSPKVPFVWSEPEFVDVKKAIVEAGKLPVDASVVGDMKIVKRSSKKVSRSSVFVMKWFQVGHEVVWSVSDCE
jgi:hypothetical protein